MGGGSGEGEEVLSVGGRVHMEETVSLLENILASKGSNAGKLFKFNLEPPDVPETIFVELQVERFC